MKLQLQLEKKRMNLILQVNVLYCLYVSMYARVPCLPGSTDRCWPVPCPPSLRRTEAGRMTVCKTRRPWLTSTRGRGKGGGKRGGPSFHSSHHTPRVIPPSLVCSVSTWLSHQDTIFTANICTVYNTTFTRPCTGTPQISQLAYTHRGCPRTSSVKKQPRPLKRSLISSSGEQKRYSRV